MSGGTKVLIVEDDVLIAMDLEDELTDRGFAVTACVTTVAQARDAIEAAPPDVAILDMHLKSETTFDLAGALQSRGVPYIFVSGNEVSALPAHLQSCPILTKPVHMDDIAALIDRIAKT